MTSREYVKSIAIEAAEAHGLENLVCADLCDEAYLPRGSFKHVMGCSFSEFVEELRSEVDTTESHPITKSRVAPDVRAANIIALAMVLAKKCGYLNVKREDLALVAGVSEATVARYTGTRSALQKTIMTKAVRDGVEEIVAQGLANGDTLAKTASVELKAKAATRLVHL